MAKKKFYGVELQNGNTDVFQNWDDAKAFIATCPSNARYQGFPTREEALAFANGTTPAKAQAKPEPQISPLGSDCAAYVDGSFNSETNVAGWGVVLFMAKSGGTEEMSGAIAKYPEHRNVTGEVYGAMQAVSRARKLGMRSITIFHDYQGIASWVTGEWKSKNEMTRTYANWMRKMQDKIAIEFAKVKGHSGDRYNDRADELAKAGCGVE